MWYPVFLVTNISTPRDSTSIFVETEDDDSGSLFSLHDDLDLGVPAHITHTHAPKPDDSPTFLYKAFLGMVAARNFAHMQDIVQRAPASVKHFDAMKGIYPGIPLGTCGEWTVGVIQALKDERVLEICD